MGLVSLEVSGEGTARISIHAVSVEQFELLLPAFVEVVVVLSGTRVGRIIIDDKTYISVFCKVPDDYVFISVVDRAVMKALEEQFIARFPPEPPEGT